MRSCLYRRFTPLWDEVPAALRQSAMFLLVVVGWVFFRSTSFSMAWTLFGKMFVPTSGLAIEGLEKLVVLLIIAAWGAMRGPNAFDLHMEWRFRRRYAIATAAAFGACIAVMAGTGSSPFLYFQF